MKNVKKFACLFLALVMALCLAIPALAVEDAYTITITGAAGHTYNVYQIFTGTPGEDADGTEYLDDAQFGANFAAPDGMTLDEVLTVLKGQTGEEAAEWLYDRLSGSAYATMTGNDETGIATTDVPAGYYLIVDVTTGLPEYDENGELIETLSAYILEIVGNATVASKHTSVPELEKKIDDKNDSNTSEDEIEWHDSADHDIGDLIDYKLEATIPSEYTLFVNNNVKYPFTFHDVEEAGLTFVDTSVEVYVDGVKITSGYNVVVNPSDGCTFEVVFADLTEISAVKAGSVITVRYQSMLNEDAIIGEVGNVNKACGEFRNYSSPETRDFTPWDAVIAFTYKVVVNKVDQNNEPLEGAEFTLEKFVANAEGAETYKGVKGDWVAKAQVETEPGTTFTFTGLDDGEYRLRETLTPNGYNTIDDVCFTVTADHDILWTDAARTDVLNTLTGDVVTGEIEFTESAVDGSLSSDVVNNKGTLLPETGGIGTTIFYTVGGVLVLAAIILLITKKRMKNEA